MILYLDIVRSMYAIIEENNTKPVWVFIARASFKPIIREDHISIANSRL